MDVECEDFNGLTEKNIGDVLEEGTNEKTLVETEESKISLPLDKNNVEEDNVGDADKTETAKPVVLLSVPQKIENVSDSTRNIDQVYENGKRKIKEEKPPTKVVVRRLPPSMTKEIFVEQVSPLPTYDYMYFVNGDPSYGIHSFSRAYINFINQEDLFTFTRTFDNYVFLDSKGQEYPAVVEFSPFQRVPKQRSKKKDTLTGSIESDPMYISFKENLLAEALENSKPGAKTMKQHYFETEISTTEEVNTTPLLEFLKQRRAEKARIRDERREEKKRKEAERKLKQKTKDKKIDGEEEETKDVKVLQTKDRRDIKDKERDSNNKGIKKKEEKDKSLKENRTREFKNRSGKSYQEERIRQAERREERKKETSIIFERKSESQCSDSGKELEKAETIENAAPTPAPLPIQEEKPRTYIEKKRIYESKRKNDSEEWKGEGDADRRSGGKTDRNRPERRQRERERKRREEFASRKGYDKKLSEMEKKKTKIYKTFPSNECSNETKESKNETDKTNKFPPDMDETTVENIQNKLKQKGNNQLQTIQSLKTDNSCRDKNDSIKTQRRKSLESGNVTDHKENEETCQTNIKRRNSLESGENTAALQTKMIAEEGEEKPITLVKNKFSEETSPTTTNTVEKKEILIKTIVNDNLKKYKSLINEQTIENREDQSKESEDGQSEQGKNEVNYNKTNITKKNSELTSITDCTSRNKDPRTDRRIRNKDRPSLQIYRPGMGKFSKQRLEKEKVLGSSTEVESPSHSPSPTPKVKFPS